MDLPKFKYHPNVYKLDQFEEEEGICSICNERRNIKYVGSFYSDDEPDYICPWCIANGKASEKYNGEFNDYCSIEGVPPDPKDPKPEIPKELLFEITNKTPSYFSWQQEVWMTHCNEPCAFIGYADDENIEQIIDDLVEDIENHGYDVDSAKKSLNSGCSSGYIFKCVKCGKHRLHIDYD